MTSLPLLDPTALEALKSGENLLAFSAGVDSTALFFLLEKAGISFDLAMVDYGRREGSKQEVAHAKKMANDYAKKLFLHTVALPDANFEARARKERYDFFASLCGQEGYDTVITAHQLNDLTEWFFMQFTKGAGTVELVGMQPVSRGSAYTLVRPMLDISRDEILAFLHTHAIRYFEDSSNRDSAYKRNRFRHSLTNDLVREFGTGIKKSFHYIRHDTALFHQKPPTASLKALRIIRRQNDETSDIRVIDSQLKEDGYLLSSRQRAEILRTKDCVIGGDTAVVFTQECIFIAPYRMQPIPKKEREAYRIAGIPPKIRSYAHIESLESAALSALIASILN